MRRVAWLPVVISLTAAACAANTAADNEALLARDRDWSQTTNDSDTFLSYFADDGNVYLPGAPIVSGTANLREMWKQMSSSPGFSLQWTPTKAQVSGTIGYTSGTYTSSTGGVDDAGKYVTVWKKEGSGP